ncbi:E3 ubiquitin-protein ligase TRIM56-like isoform X2 [Mya arenaria]|uniref:E3 ubiquitin-protein ligase TRIM56-like isoform X2 n=1 Tax=Mya arenaria TaxID=6604 RepID=UPI0022DEDDB7|nr:E3 ubiquitin-protein ligase TRIM56-like isoform X2 [Mya arenaria]
MIQELLKPSRLMKESAESEAMMDVQSECEVIPRDFLCCKLCEEEFRQPKYLTCFHSFCQACIQGYATQRGGANDGNESYWCPVCGTETAVDDHSINALPDNILAQRLGSPSTNTQQKDTICTICKNGGNFIDAKNYCLNCEEFLCNECTDVHLEQADTMDHNLETMEEFGIRSEYEESAKSGHVIPRCCSYYDPLDIGALFCVDCDIAVCGDCHLSYHEDHRCAEMVAVAENFQNKIKQPLEELQNDATQLQEAMIDLQKAETKTIEQQKELHKSVKNRTKYLYELIMQYENVLLEEIDRRHTQNLDDIHERRKELQMHLAAIDGVNDFTEKLMTYGSCEEKVLMRKKVGKRVRELCEEPLLTDQLSPPNVTLTEPNVAIPTVCNMFGELKDPDITKIDNDIVDVVTDQVNVDSGHESEPHENNEVETNGHVLLKRSSTIESESSILGSTTESDVKMLTMSNNSETFRGVKFSDEVEETEYIADNVFTLENPRREINLPLTIQKECLKGIGVNEFGDIIIGAAASNYQMVYLLEKRGIIRGQIPVQAGWNIHTVACDGKVALTIARGDNRYKVRIMKNDGSGKMLCSMQIENYGLNFVTADNTGNLIVASNRYSHVTNSGKITSKAGGNISIYDQRGMLKRRITNEDYQDLGMYILEKPHCIVVDKVGNFFVADPGNHNVTGFDSSGELLFEYGNNDHEPEIYDGPDLVCTDTKGNVIVADKRMGKIDVISMKGDLKKSLFTEDIIKYITITADKLLMVSTAEGSIKFYEYLKL